jgi:hypothetical protein
MTPRDSGIPDISAPPLVDDVDVAARPRTRALVLAVVLRAPATRQEG